MSRGWTIFLVLVAVGLTVFVGVYVTLTSGGGREVGGALFSFEPSEIRGMTITQGEQEFEVRRTDYGWRIVPEPGDRASAEMVRQLLELARTTAVLDKIPGGEISGEDAMAEFGLQRSRMQLDFRGDGDHALLFGKDAADESRVYVRFEDSRDVYLISDELARAIFRSAHDFRDRRLTVLRPDRIERLVIRRPGGEIEIQRGASGWQIVRPMVTAADSAAVEDFLQQILRLRIETFTQDAAANPASVGLTEPAAEVLLFAEGEQDPESLAIGNETPGGGVHARFLPRGVYFLLPDTVRELLATDLPAFRDRAVARVNLDLVDRIRMERDGKLLELNRRGEQWVGRIEGKDIPIEAARVEALAAKLASTKVNRFETAGDTEIVANGLANPLARVVFLSVATENTPEAPAGEQVVLDLALAGPGADGAVATLRAGSPEIGFVEPALLDAVSMDPAVWAGP